MLSASIYEESLPAALAEAAEWERAAKLLDIDSVSLQKIRRPAFEGQVQLPFEFFGPQATLFFAADSFGAHEKLLWLRLRERFTPSEMAHDLREFRLQLAIAESPLRGAIVGIAVSPTATERELWQLAITAGPVISHLFGSVQLHATDLRSAVFADWMAEAPGSMIAGAETQSVGQQRDEALSQLALETCRRVLKDHGRGIARCKFSVIGAHPSTVPFMEELIGQSARLDGVADESGGLLWDQDLDTRPFLKHIAGEGLLAEYDGGEHVLRTQVMEREIDLLILDSPVQEVSAGATDRIHAKVILDLTGCAVTPDAARSLLEKGTSVVPGRLLHALALPHDRKRDDIRFRQLWQTLCDKARQLHLNLPDALLVLALERLSEAERRARPW